jgi:2-C-methyl-D-erythritol 2,4-cyclodiphosphate synthase
VRVGLGYDAHAFEHGRPLVLAGCSIPFERGLAGFSDADVACHAIIDAILGAAALGDCGSHFPAGNPEFAGARSTELLTRACGLLAAAGYRIRNVDCTLVAEAPALAPHIPDMRAQLAASMGITPGQCSVKAKRTEGLGFTGEGKGIEAFAVACIEEVE